MKIKQKAAAAAIAVICLLILAVPTAAEEAESGRKEKKTAQIQISASVEVKNEPKESRGIYTIWLSAVDEAPMPENSGREIALTLAGGETGSFPAITYINPGIYYYTVHQEADGTLEETKSNSIFYDKTVFFLKVTVSAAPDGEIEAAAAAYTDEAHQGKKQQDIIFINEYRPEKTTEEETEETEMESTEAAVEESTEKTTERSQEETSAEKETQGQTAIAQVLGVEDGSLREGIFLISAGAALLFGAGIAGVSSRKKR